MLTSGNYIATMLHARSNPFPCRPPIASLYPLLLAAHRSFAPNPEGPFATHER